MGQIITWFILFRNVNLFYLKALDVLRNLSLTLYYYYYYYYYFYYYICHQFYAGYLQLHIWNQSVSTAHNVGTVMYLQTVLHIMLFSRWYFFRTLIFAHSEMRAVSNMAVFVVPWFQALPVWCSGTLWMIMRWFSSPTFSSNAYAFAFHML